MPRVWSTLRPVLALAIGLLLGSLVTVFAGESPIEVLYLLGKSAFGSLYDFGMSLFYATPLLFTGLAVALAFRGGLFNIGAEGQLTLGALAAVIAGIELQGLPWPLGSAVAVLVAFLVGGLWGAIPGALKAWRGSHEVITTIMLNFIAAGLASYVALYGYRNTAEQAPETLPVGDGFLFRIYEVFDDAPVSAALLLGLAVALLVQLLLDRTVLGFRIRAVGESATAAARGAISIGWTRVLTMTLSGGVAGLAGLFDVLGPSGRFKLGFSADFGFTGIAVALLGRSRPFGVVLAALLFGALHKGAADLDFETENVTRDLALVLQATVILTVAADGLWDLLQARARRKRGGPA